MAEIVLGRILGPSGFERPVVIKRILPHLAKQSDFVTMFLDEARIVAGIRHPNVVQVHELGHEDGELYLVMEYLEGESAAGLMRRLRVRGTRLDFALVAHIVAEACAGLHAAHELTDPDGNKQNVVHRDVSPQNIFITYAGGVKVLDFGIATAADRVTRTEAGQFKGKFEYSSPEQCLGKPVDRRSDVFALGILLYELSTGTRLFKRFGQLNTLRAICEAPIVPPTEILTDYPVELSAIVMRALQRRREARYETALDMRRELIRVSRQLGGDITPDEELARLMQTLFEDRIEEKADLLRRVRACTTVGELPSVETDGSVEIPVAFSDAETSIPPGAGEIAAQPAMTMLDTKEIVSRRARTPVSTTLVAAGGLVILVLLVIVSLVGRPKPPAVTASRDAPLASAASAAASTAESPPAAAATTAVVSTPAAPHEVLLRIETVPAKAHVRLDGVDQGTSPVDLHVSRSDRPVRLEVRHDGYHPHSETVVPNMDQKLRLTLSGALAAPLKPSSSAKANPYRRFD